LPVLASLTQQVRCHCPRRGGLAWYPALR